MDLCVVLLEVVDCVLASRAVSDYPQCLAALLLLEVLQQQLELSGVIVQPHMPEARIRRRQQHLQQRNTHTHSDKSSKC